MAESVDALVSNTSGETHPGSSPGLGTQQEAEHDKVLRFSYLKLISQLQEEVCLRRAVDLLKATGDDGTVEVVGDAQFGSEHQTPVVDTSHQCIAQAMAIIHWEGEII